MYLKRLSMGQHKYMHVFVYMYLTYISVSNIKLQYKRKFTSLKQLAVGLLQAEVDL